MPEIVIVGGGVVGAATAYYMTRGNVLPAASQDGVRIVVLEEVELAAAASGKSGGFLHSEWQRGSATGKLAELSYQLHEDLAKEHDGYNAWQYRPLSTYGISAVLGAKDEDRSESENNTGDSDGQELSPEGAPELSEWIESSKIQTASQVGTIRTCSQVTPGLFTKELIRLAVETGRCQVVYGKCTKVNFRDVADEDDDEKDEVVESVEYVNTSTLQTGTIPASHVVFATGPWTGTLLQQLLPHPFDLGRVTNVTGRRAHSIIVKESPAPGDASGIPPHALFTEIQIKRPGSTRWVDLTPEVYPRPDKTVYICGEGDTAKLPDSAALVKVDDSYTDVLEHIATALVPRYLDLDAPNGAKLLAKQACYLPVVEAYNMSPIIDEIESTNVFVATGHSVWGIMNAPATGLLMAELVLTGRPTIDISRFSL